MIDCRFKLPRYNIRFMAANDNSKNRRSNGGDNLLKERGEWDLKGDAEGFK